MYRFGEFRLDPSTRELLHGDDRVVLAPKLFECLLWLIEHRDRAVGRDELIAAVWGKVDAGDNLLAQVIARLRRMLDADGGSAIRTIPRFGYRWVASTECVAQPDPAAAPAAATADVAAAAGSRRHRPRFAHAVLLVVLVLGCALAWFAMRFAPRSGTLADAPPALLLPVEIEAPPGQAWMRLGLMALMIERLRVAGQPMVPGENVVALLGPADAQTHADPVTAARAAWPGAMVIAARARAGHGGWSVTLQTRAGRDPPLQSAAQAADALDAARQAADALAAQLGFQPLPIRSADYEPSLAQRLLRVEAAILGGELDQARRLIEAATANDRESPELRYQQAWLDFNAGRLEPAQRAFEALLADLSPTDAPLSRARALNGLANVQYERGDIDGLRRSADAALALLQDRDAPGETGRALIGRAVARSQAGDAEAARRDFAQAHVALESAGDRLGVARATLAAAVLDQRHGRLGEAVRAFEDAAATLALFDDVHDELIARIHLAGAHLLLLDPAAALALEPRLRALAARAKPPRSRALADIVRIEILLANGRTAAAASSFRQACGAAAAGGACAAKSWPLQLARVACALDAAADGCRLREALADLPAGAGGRDAGRAWLTLLRAALVRGRIDEAQALDAAIGRWSAGQPALEVRMHAALAHAELAAMTAGVDATRAAFERARELAESTQVPADMLEVARSYAGWLLGQGDLAGASIVAGRGAAWARRDFDAAVLQLRLQHALGHPGSWRTALGHAQALAGERALPEDLLVPPTRRGAPATQSRTMPAGTADPLAHP